MAAKLALRKGGLPKANLWTLITWDWVTPLVNLAGASPLEEHDADHLLAGQDGAAFLSEQFQTAYKELQVRLNCTCAAQTSSDNTTQWANLEV
jgi:hypothetical protein